MANPFASTDTDPRGGYVVRAPRPTDAVGSSLRNVYAAEPRLPSDLALLLSRLDARSH